MVYHASLPGLEYIIYGYGFDDSTTDIKRNKWIIIISNTLTHNILLNHLHIGFDSKTVMGLDKTNKNPSFKSMY